MSQSKIDTRWVPVLNGDIFCSPGCGFKCTKKSYDQTVKRVNELCGNLGSNWIPRVWENGGWHYTAKLIVPDGYIEIYPRKGENYWVDSRLPGQFYVTTNNVSKGIDAVLNQAKLEADKTLKILADLSCRR